MNFPLFPILVLFLWIPLAVGMFSIFRPAKAITITLLAGMLFLPEVVNIPGLKFLGKFQVSACCGMLGCLIFARRRFRHLRLGRGVDLLVWLKLIGLLVTAALNREPLFYGPTSLPGMGTYDAFSNVVRGLSGMAFPFWLGRMAIRSSRDARLVLRITLIFGLIYSLFELFEMRMSPNLHNWVYGIVTFENFSMAIRWGGYRPTVFLVHGLATAIFTLVATMSAVTHAKLTQRMWGLPTWFFALYMGIILVLCRSTGAIIFGLAFIPILLFLKPSRWFKITLLGSLLFWVYPALRIVDLFPDEQLANLALSSTNADRTQSLTFRFENERLLVKKAQERIYWGWGGYGRNRVYNDAGYDTTITDGAWIITLSAEGVVGLIAFYGLVFFPIAIAARRSKRILRKKHLSLLGGYSFIVLVYLLDMLPNGAFTYAPHFFAGALLQLSSVLIDEENQDAEATDDPAMDPMGSPA